MKEGVTVNPPDTALSNVTVNVSASPSDVLASLIVTAALSSLVIVPVAEEVADTLWVVPETANPTVNVSLPSTSSSSLVETLNVCVSPAVPVKVNAVVGLHGGYDGAEL